MIYTTIGLVILCISTRLELRRLRARLERVEQELRAEGILADH